MENTITNINTSRLIIDRETNKLKLDCKENEKWYYFSGPLTKKSLKKRLTQRELNQLQNNKNATLLEYGLGCCPFTELKKLE